MRLTVEALHADTHTMFMGGWQSVTGEMGKGGRGRYARLWANAVDWLVADALPVS